MLPVFRPQMRVDKEIIGSSPPSIFVGRYGYPKVRICPAVPPFTGDTKAYDTPEMWREMPVEKVLEFRYSMILGQFRADIKSGREVEIIQEMSLYDKPVDVEISFTKPPSVRASFDDVLPPFGASAPAKEVRIHSSPRAPRL